MYTKNKITLQLNIYEFIENPEKWDSIKKEIQEYIKYLNELRNNTEKLLKKKKIEFVDLFLLQIKCIGEYGECFTRYFDYNINTDELEGNTFLKRIKFNHSDSQQKIKNNLLDILFKTGHKIGSYISLIRHYENMMIVITNQKDKLIIGDTIQQLPAKTLYDLSIAIVKKDFSKHQLLFTQKVFEYIRILLKKETKKKKIINEDIYKFILSLHNGKIKPPKLSSFRTSHSRYNKNRLFFQ